MAWIHASAGGCRITIRLVPRAGRNQVDGLLGDAVKIRLAAPPVEGKANAALVRFLADQLDCPARAVRLCAGAASRHKVVEIAGLAPAAVARRLGLPGA